MTNAAGADGRKADIRLLFVPVSGARGMGEYARCAALARAAQRRWPHAIVHFAVSRAAPYAADSAFPITLLPASPTFHSREVCSLIREFKPTVVIFDNAGRTAQLHAAQRSGARVVFVSSRRKQRFKAFRWRWMGFIDEHWIAYPEFIAGPLTAFERLKLRLRKRPRVRFLDTLLPPPDGLAAAAVMRRLDVRPGYVLIVPGGGSAHSSAENAPRVVAAAARAIAERGHCTILVGLTAGGNGGAPSGLRSAPLMPLDELAELIRGARLVICNGGDTLLQVIACGRPCIAVAIAGDQSHRIERCAERGLTLRSRLEESALAGAALAYLDRPAEASGASGAAGSALTNAMDLALDALGALAGTEGFTRPQSAS
jgi:ADP-heptose:LPS heptosyltransferase